MVEDDPLLGRMPGETIETIEIGNKLKVHLRTEEDGEATIEIQIDSEEAVRFHSRGCTEEDLAKVRRFSQKAVCDD